MLKVTSHLVSTTVKPLFTQTWLILGNIIQNSTVSTVSANEPKLALVTPALPLSVEDFDVLPLSIIEVFANRDDLSLVRVICGWYNVDLETFVYKVALKKQSQYMEITGNHTLTEPWHV